MSDIKDAMVGRHIERFELDGLGQWITFHFEEDEPLTLYAMGDCCSQSWIESIDAPTVLIGEVISVEDIEMPHLGHIATAKHPDVEYVQYYGLKIITEKGHCIIDYRNDSNGWYGGDLVIRRNREVPK